MEIKSEPSWANEEVMLDEDFIFDHTSTKLYSDETYDKGLFKEVFDSCFIFLFEIFIIFYHFCYLLIIFNFFLFVIYATSLFI